MEVSISGAEDALRFAVLWLKLGVEVVGAAMIAMGVMAACRTWLSGVRDARRDAFSESRLQLARFLALALELQLGADILSTAVAPTWDQIGKLASIAVIRTALNYFLQREMRGAPSAEGVPLDSALAKVAT